MEFKLPTAIVSQVDINRLLRELSALNDFFISAAARESGTSIKPPRITYLLQQIATDNKLNLLEKNARNALSSNLKTVLTQGPQLHISFAAEPPPRIVDSIVSWLRQNVHPYTLLQVGLQPTIAAGCMLRTPNKVFDMSLRAYLESQENYLVELIQGAVRGK